MPKETSAVISSFDDLKSLSIERFSYTKDGAPFSCISFSGFPCLKELKLINLNIKKIPDDICLLQALEKLDLSGNDFSYLPTSTKNLSSLKYLNLSSCITLEALPRLTELHTLKLSGCSNLEYLLEPSHPIQEIHRYRLLELELDDCKNVKLNQLSYFTNLIYLDLSSHDFEAIPESIRELVSLGILYLNNCKKLESVEMEELPLSLEHLYAYGCDSLGIFNLSPNHSIKHLDLSHCFSLQQEEEHLITQFLNDGYSQEVSERFLCLPGDRVPSYFDNRSPGTSTKIWLPTIRFNPTVLGFAACIMIACEGSFSMSFPAFSYDWNFEDDEVIRINIKPKLYDASAIEEEETVALHHLVIIHVLGSVNTEKMGELQLESHLQQQVPEELEFPPGEIRGCGVGMILEDYTN